MCNINAIIRTNKSKENYTIPLQNATAHSFVGNSYSEGVYFNSLNQAICSNKKIDITKYSQDMQDSNVIIAHERLATSGFTEQNTQPIQIGEWVITHNGIFGNTHEDITKSDTFLFAELFYVNIQKEKSINKAINKTLKQIGYGSYSVILYNSDTKKIYYFKSEWTQIHFTILDNEDLFIHTEKKNNLFFKIRTEYEIGANILYNLIIKDNKIQVINIGNLSKEVFKNVWSDKDYTKENQKNLKEYIYKYENDDYDKELRMYYEY